MGDFVVTGQPLKNHCPVGARGEKLLVVLDPSQIISFAHAEEILREVNAKWAKERRDRGLVTYEPLPPVE
jgi:hypothetical protein